MKSGSELRELFLSYFETKGHKRVKSHSLIPPADPTLLFVNAGMVQFKDIFVGHRSVDYRRAASSQKCLRVSGKHNDLENVGRTARHHTFFEMLGNFSFGDYFKKEAIEYAYEFLTKHVGLDKSRMYYTIFGGDQADGILADVEAKDHWMSIAGVGEDRILAFGKKDNFWSMGETGPCGPCSEILYDRGPGPWACGKPECAPGCDCDRYVEIWNLVFMQYERKTPGAALVPLPAPSIDTGMGLERLSCIVQGKATNYDTDLFMPIIETTREIFAQQNKREVAYGKDPETDVCLRVIADHSRSVAMLITDGVYPDNEGRGYIVRLLMRRAVRFGRKMGFVQPFFDKVCDAVIELLSPVYPDLSEKRDVIRKVVQVEEASFTQTYDDGRRSLEDEIARLAASGQRVIGGDFLFLLHDERGFQPDLVEVIAAESGFSIDREGYEARMDEKRRASGKAEGKAAAPGQAVFRRILEQKGPTEFTGYEQLSTDSTILALVMDHQEVATIPAGESGQVVLDLTPFYAESGGQCGDQGQLMDGMAVLAEVSDVRKVGTLWVHDVVAAQGLRAGMVVKSVVDSNRRRATAAHHSATHLLHWALEKVLGAHVKQEGSQVRPDLLRFDFRHFSPLTADETEAIERLVLDQILNNTPVETAVMGLEEATSSGAKAFFDEKYGAEVRLVTMGHPKSRELCGGTHATRTGDIGGLRIIKQEAVSSGIRRVYAVCHKALYDHDLAKTQTLASVASTLRCPVDEVEPRVKKALERISDLEKEIKDMQRKLLDASAQGGGGATDVEDLGPVRFAHALLEAGDANAVRDTADLLRDRIQSGVVLVAGVTDGKALVVLAKTKGVSDSFHCGKAMAQLASVMGVRGGGKPDFAQAGGGNPAAWNDAVAWVRDELKRIV